MRSIKQGEFRSSLAAEMVIGTLYGPIRDRPLMGTPFDEESFLSKIEKSVFA